MDLTLKSRTAAQIEIDALIKNAGVAPKAVQIAPKMIEAGKTVIENARL